MRDKMKNKIKFLLVPCFVMLAFSFNGCILDAFDTLTTGIPISVDVNINGSDTSMESSSTFNLDENDTYNKNKSKINSIKFVKIAYRTKSVTPASLSGNIILTVAKTDGTVIFTKTLTNVKPADYITTPMELQLTQPEIQLMDAFLAGTSNRTFVATVKIQNVTSGDKSLQAVIDIVFDMEYDL
jgi:hypothetical protein